MSDDVSHGAEGSTHLVLYVANQSLKLLFERATYARSSHNGRQVDGQNPFILKGLDTKGQRGETGFRRTSFMLTSGTSFETIRLASPSSIAVLPTPGGPMSCDPVSSLLRLQIPLATYDRVGLRPA